MARLRFKNPNVRRGVQRLGKITNRLGNDNLNENRRGKLELRQGKLQERYGDNIQNKLGQIDTRRGSLQQKLDSGNLKPKRAGRLENRIGRLDKRADRLSSLIPSNEPYSEPSEEVEPTISSGGPLPPTNYDQQIKDLMAVLLPQTGLTDAQQYITDTLQPVKDWQQSEGQTAMDRYYAGRGLTKSGAEAEGNRRFVTDLNARFADRALDLAGDDLTRRQSNATRLSDMLRDEADRAQRGEQNQFDNMMEVIQTMIGENPIGYGANAAGKSADLTAMLGSQAAEIIAGLYPGIPPAGAFATGSTPIPGFIPPGPAAPSSIPGESAGISAGAANSAGTTSSIIDILSSLGLF